MKIEREEQADLTKQDDQIFGRVWDSMQRPATPQGKATATAMVMASLQDEGSEETMNEITTMAYEGSLPGGNFAAADEQPFDPERSKKLDQWILDQAKKRAGKKLKKTERMTKRMARKVRKTFDPSQAREPNGEFMDTGRSIQPAPKADPPAVQNQESKPESPQDAAEQYSSQAGDAIVRIRDEFVGKYTELLDLAMNPDLNQDGIDNIDKDAYEHSETAKDQYAEQVRAEAQKFLDHLSEHYGVELEGHQDEIDKIVDDNIQYFADKMDEWVDHASDAARMTANEDHDNATAHAQQFHDSFEDEIDYLANSLEKELKTTFDKYIDDHEQHASDKQ